MLILVSHEPWPSFMCVRNLLHASCIEKDKSVDILPDGSIENVVGLLLSLVLRVLKKVDKLYQRKWRLVINSY